MANLTATTITGNLDIDGSGVVTGDAGGISNVAAGNIASGTLASDRLPTVPTTKGGTGLTSIGSAGQVLTVSAPGSALEFADAGGGGNYIRRIYTSPATWTYDASIQAIKVTVVGGGGSGGTANGPGSGGNGGSGGFSDEYLSAPALSAPVSVTVGGAGGTSSFGAFLSATGGNGGGGSNSPGAQGSHGSPGSGSGGNINEPANPSYAIDYGSNYTPYGAPGNGIVFRAWGSLGRYTNSTNLGNPGEGYGGGGRGGSNRNIPAFPGTGGTGAPGIVVVEEFY